MKICILAVLLTAVASPSLALDMMSDQILAIHNGERAAVGVGPLSWSDELAADAQVWADHLAAENKFEHSSSGDGENLWMGTTGYYSYGDMAQSWADEKALFKYGAFLQTIVDFLIIAFAIFVVVKIMNSLKKKEEAAPPPGPSDEVKLLTEIRDALQAK